jgi:hypothetical protein
MSVFDLVPTSNVLGLQVKAFIFGLMSGVMGFVSGRIFRVANFVIDYDKIKGKLDIKISKYSVGA